MNAPLPARGTTHFARLAAIFLAFGCLAPLLTDELPAVSAFWREETASRPTADSWGSPNAGEEVLAPDVRAMIALLRSRSIVRFRESQRLQHADESTRQRLAEGAYPIVLDAQASTVLMLPGEAAPRGCAIVETRPEAAVADCR